MILNNPVRRVRNMYYDCGFAELLLRERERVAGAQWKIETDIDTYAMYISVEEEYDGHFI